jgi:hypothetical protein
MMTRQFSTVRERLEAARDSLMAQPCMRADFWQAPAYGLKDLLLVGLMPWLLVVVIVAQLAAAAPAQLSAPAGQGLPGGQIDLHAEPDGGYATAKGLVEAFAVASSTGSFFDAERYMQGVDEMTKLTWRDSVSENIGKGYISAGSGAVKELDPMGAGKTALIQWTGKGRSVCAAVEVSRYGQIRPLSFPRFCPKGME